MKIRTMKEVEMPNEKVYETILKWYYEHAKEDKEGWSVFSSFKDFIQCRYNQAVNNEDGNWEKYDLKK